MKKFGVYGDLEREQEGMIIEAKDEFEATHILEDLNLKGEYHYVEEIEENNEIVT